MRNLVLLIYSCFVFSQNIPFDVGETLTYDAFISGIPAGRGELKVCGLDTISNLPVYHVQVRAWTTGFTKTLYPLDDKINIWLDKESLNTIKVVKKIKQGSYEKNSISHLNHSEGWAIVDGDSIPIPTGTQSPYALFYLFRSKNFLRLEKNIFTTIDEKKIANLTFNLVPKKRTNVPFGSFISNKLEPSHTQGKKFKNKGEMSIWFSDNSVQIPIKILLKLKYGSLELRLKDYTN